LRPRSVVRVRRWLLLFCWLVLGVSGSCCSAPGPLGPGGGLGLALPLARPGGPGCLCWRLAWWPGFPARPLPVLRRCIATAGVVDRGRSRCRCLRLGRPVALGWGWLPTPPRRGVLCAGRHRLRCPGPGAPPFLGGCRASVRRGGRAVDERVPVAGTRAPPGGPGLVPASAAWGGGVRALPGVPRAFAASRPPVLGGRGPAGPRGVPASPGFGRGLARGGFSSPCCALRTPQFQIPTSLLC